MFIRYPDGIDCVWIATDRLGRVAAFVTGGSGPVPKALLGSIGLPIEEIEGHIDLLPQISTVRLTVVVPRPDDFISMAQRGLYVYDWTDVHRVTHDRLGAYELVASPLVPIGHRELTKELADASTLATLNEVDFASQQSIEVRKWLDCQEAGRRSGEP